MRILPICLALAASLLTAFAVSVPAQVGPPGGAIYASDRLFRTVGTPTDLPERGKFNTIYTFSGGLASVADVAPGESGYRGGRWEVHEVTFVNIAPTQFTNDEDLLAAAAAGEVSIGPVIRRFECPLIPAE
jgi:hypothetical protein